ELQRRHVEVNASDVQAAFDAMRRRRGLFTVDALQAWIRNSGVTMAALQDLATKRARAAKLRQLVVADGAEAYFAAHSQDFDAIKLALFQSRSAAAAQRIAGEIRRGESTLASAAQTAFLSGSGEGLAFRTLERRAIQSEFGSVDTTEGAVQVIELDHQFWVLQVLAIQRVEHSPATLERVKAALFRDWLAEQRSAAKVEWFWGDAQRTKQELAA
ncbi:MAG TPA: hypothetical protein VFS24_00540, partial [Steroidobacteraceae bacterium]|nr:hypothetical protein [Steroidobacteraceae bacterium]